MYEKPELANVGQVAEIVLGAVPPGPDNPEDKDPFAGIVLGLDE